MMSDAETVYDGDVETVCDVLYKWNSGEGTPNSRKPISSDMTLKANTILPYYSRHIPLMGIHNKHNKHWVLF